MTVRGPTTAYHAPPRRYRPRGPLPPAPTRYDLDPAGDGGWLRVGPVKFFVDGGYTGAAAWTLGPYRRQPGCYGTGPLIDEAGLFAISSAAHERGNPATTAPAP